VVSHPFAENANGWGTEHLWVIDELFVISHPFRKERGKDGASRLIADS
jgi:hypothetical protein